MLHGLHTLLLWPSDKWSLRLHSRGSITSGSPAVPSLISLKNLLSHDRRAGHKNRAGCLPDQFRRWVIWAEARTILNEMALGATIPCRPPLHYPIFLDPCLSREWISCSYWVIAPFNLYTAYWMAVATMSSLQLIELGLVCVCVGGRVVEHTHHGWSKVALTHCYSL